jgi:hypothetical protein
MRLSEHALPEASIHAAPGRTILQLQKESPASPGFSSTRFAKNYFGQITIWVNGGT